MQLPQFVPKQKVRNEHRRSPSHMRCFIFNLGNLCPSFQKIVTDEGAAKPDEEAVNTGTTSDDSNPAALAQEFREAVERAKVGPSLDCAHPSILPFSLH